MTKVVLTANLTEQQAAEMLAQGGTVVFGDQFLDVATGLANGASGTPVLAGQRVADLKLPDALMVYGFLLFAHTLPGGEGRPGTEADLAAWRDELFDRVDFVVGDEPMPKAEFMITDGTRNVTTMLTWASPASGPWNGVRSGQLRRIAAQFEARHDRAMASRARGAAPSAPAGWRRFDHPDGLFSIEYPARWSERRVPGSGAALSCVSSDGSELLEVLVMEASGPRHGDEVARIAADGMVKDIGSRSGGRVVHRRVIASSARGGRISLVGEHYEGGQNFTTEYLFIGAGKDALYVALKCPSARFSANKADFDQACASLLTAWGDSAGHGVGTGLSGPHYSQAPPPVPPPTANLNYRPSSKYLDERRAERAAQHARQERETLGCQLTAGLVVAAIAAAAVWFFVF